MKKVFLSVFFILSILVCNAQNKEIDIKYLHSTEGRQWKIYDRPDGYQVPSEMKDDLFVFYSNGQFRYDPSGTISQELAEVRTRNWSYNANTNTVTWEYYLPKGVIKRIDAEITFIDQNKAVLNLSENGKEPNILVLVHD